jgi:hypothetical protein
MDQTERISTRKEPKKTTNEDPFPENKTEIAKDTHLIDWGNVQEVAQWVGMFLLGLLGNVAYDMTKDAVREMLVNLKQRFGKSKVREVETKVTALIKKAKEESSLSDEEIAARVEDIFRDFQ